MIVYNISSLIAYCRLTIVSLSHNYRSTSTQRKLQHMKANYSSRIFDQQSICACGEVSCLRHY